jgi:uncharacterized protein YndB with AHSA1/START domain
MTSTEAPPVTTTQVYRVYIKATADAIWTALTDPEWTDRYAYGGFVHYDLKPGGALVVNPAQEMIDGAAAQGYELPDVIIDGEVIEARRPHLLKSTWRMLMDESMIAEGFTRLTYEIAEGRGGVSKLTVIHELEGKPQLQLLMSGGLEDMGAGGGWNWVLSDLKSLLETGASLDPQDPLNQG